ncbi:virulence factor [Skermanella sp. TT6]|uniref:Virulence factor n=1 Tax=Skermanella cutis TaxID=2775420 RepID=A0ABX7B6F5_9PROT|nr:virulence factor SrfC family protein [Skermanella sp. TT6]QQP89205.1 virulence factor [Skermanella sp. TT6]
MNDQQIRLKSAADRIAATARRTRSWVSEARGASVSVANEADSLVTEARRVESVARKLSRAAERRMCVGVYGASQQGKSYLVSVLARPPGKAGLLARLGADRLDFITEINPSGGKESTGLVTRFTVHPPEGPADPDFPVDVRLLTETDIVKILSNAFQSDFDQNNLKIERPRGEAVRKLLAACEGLRKAQPTARHLDEITLFDIGEYFGKNFSNRWQELQPLGYWERLVELAPFLDIDGRAKLFSVLWGGIDDLTALFRTLVAALDRLGHAADAVTQLASLQPRNTSIIDVAALKRLGQPSDARDLLRLRSLADGRLGDPVELPRAVVTTLVAELRITIDEQPWPMNAHTDLLDFPGARSRYKLAELPEPGATTGADEQSREGLVLELLLRGKIAYLFQRYSEERELTALLLCMGNKPNEVKDLGFLVRHWIELTHGATPEQRARVTTSLFLVLTMIDLEFQAKAGEDIDQKWQIRLHTSLLEPYKYDGWVDNFDGRPFDNTLLLRNPNFDQEWLVEYRAKPGSHEPERPLVEEALSRRNEAHRRKLEESFFASTQVQRHVRDPRAAWEAILKLNDGGVTHIVDRLTGVSDPALKAAQVEQRLRESVLQLQNSLKRFYHGVDEEARREKEEALKALRKALVAAFQRKRFRTFPRFLSHLMVGERDLREIALNVAVMKIEEAEEAPPDDLDIFGSPVAAAAPARTARDDRPALFARELHRHWVGRLRHLPQEEQLLQHFGLEAQVVGDLVDQLVIAADRVGMIDKVATAIRSETALAAMRWDEIADRLVTIASNAFNVFVAEMGFHDVPSAQRPGVPEGSPTPNHRVFEPPPPVTGALPALGDEPLLLEQRYFIDWGVAFLQAGLANLSYGGGRELDEAQNRALGDILSNLSVDRLLAGPIRPA